MRPKSRRSFLGPRFLSTLILVLAVLLSSPFGVAQTHPQVSLETSESLFVVLTAINACGYDQELNASDPLRAQIRAEVAKIIADVPAAKAAATPMCTAYVHHDAGEPSRNLSQFISLALYLQEAPPLTLKVQEAEMPPDASAVADMVPLMQTFYEKAGLHSVWERHRPRYEELMAIYHEPLAKMTFDTEIYLKLPSSGYLGRQFTVYLDAMGPPGQTNARNYASDYYVVFSPTSGTMLKMQQIRHTYLHYLLDPLAMKNGAANLNACRQLCPHVQKAPMDEAFKSNVSLLVTECLVRAVELRTAPAKTTEAERTQSIDDDDREGYVLTRYFYEALAKFEKDPAGSAQCLS